MPPKAKKEKLTEDRIQELCLEYMISQNRPYNSTDIALNLHEQFTKAAAQKALQALADKGEIDVKNIAKEGKSTLIFCAKQPDDAHLDATSLAKLDEELVALKASLIAAKEENKQLLTDVNELYATKSTEDLKVEVRELEQAIEGATRALEPFESGSRRLYSVAEVTKVNRDFDLYRKAHKKHRKEFEDVFATLCEGMEKNKKESIVWREELGIDEVDEDPAYCWYDDPLSGIFKKLKRSI